MTENQIDALIDERITELLVVQQRATHSDVSQSVEINRDALRSLLMAVAERTRA